MKIIWLTTIFDDSAVSNVLLRILPYMSEDMQQAGRQHGQHKPAQQSNIECLVVSLESHKKSYKALETLGIYNIRHISFDCKKYEIMKSKRKLQDLIKQEKPDIVHAQLGRAYIALLLAQRKYKPYYKPYYKLATFHNTAEYFNPLTLYLLKLFYHRFDGVSAVSQYCLDTIQHCFDRKRKVYAEVIYNPVPLPPKADATTGVTTGTTTGTQKKDTIIIAVIGRLIEGKGHDLWMKALPHIKQRFDDTKKTFEVWCVGEGYLYDTIVRGCNELGFSGETVKMLGHIHNVYEIMAQASVVLFPSQDEGFGLVPCEAILCGTPVIVQDMPVMRELLGEALLLTDCTHPEVFADKIYDVLNRKEVYKSTVVELQQRLQNILSPQIIAADYANLYKSLRGF